MSIVGVEEEQTFWDIMTNVQIPIQTSFEVKDYLFGLYDYHVHTDVALGWRTKPNYQFGIMKNLHPEPESKFEATGQGLTDSNFDNNNNKGTTTNTGGGLTDSTVNQGSTTTTKVDNSGDFKNL